MTDDQHLHLVNIEEVKKMTVGELVQRIADHEKQYIEQLKMEALKREDERSKRSGSPSKKRAKRKSINKER